MLPSLVILLNIYICCLNFILRIFYVAGMFLCSVLSYSYYSIVFIFLFFRGFYYLILRFFSRCLNDLSWSYFLIFQVPITLMRVLFILLFLCSCYFMFLLSHFKILFHVPPRKCSLRIILATMWTWWLIMTFTKFFRRFNRLVYSMIISIRFQNETVI